MPCNKVKATGWSTVRGKNFAQEDLDIIKYRHEHFGWNAPSKVRGNKAKKWKPLSPKKVIQRLKKTGSAAQRPDGGAKK